MKTHNDRSGLEAVLSDVGLEAEVVWSIQPTSAHQKSRQLAAEERGEGSGRGQGLGSAVSLALGRDFCETRAGFLNKKP